MSDLFYHAHQVINDRCTGRMKCMRICPTQAIRLRGGKATFLNELCIDCGECLNACPEEAFIPLNEGIADFGNFKYVIAAVSPVLYTQFGHDISPLLIHRALKNLGFHEVVDFGQRVDELAVALTHHLNVNTKFRPLISSFCPSIVRLIQVKYPNLVNLIEPFDVAREMVVKRIKQTYPKKLGLKEKEIGTIYISPCPAKIASIKQPAEKESSWIDGSIPIQDIYNLILPEILEIKKKGINEERAKINPGRRWGILGQISRDMDTQNCLAVAGFSHVKMILDDIEQSKLRNIDYIEALACRQGCVGGAFCVENPYIARHNSIYLEKRYCERVQQDETEIIAKYQRGDYFLENPILPRPTRAFDMELSASIRKMRQKDRILMKLPNKDCGLCGAPTCETFAEDCARGEADLADCVFFSDRFNS